MIKYSYTFYLDAEERDDQRLKVRIRWNNIVLGYSLGYRVNRSRWNPDTNRCVRNSFHGDKKIPAYIINERIADMEEMIHTAFKNLADRYIVPTKEQLDKEIKVMQGKVIDSERDLFTLLTQHLMYKNKSGVKDSTIKAIKSWQKGIKQYFPNKPIENFTKIEFMECYKQLCTNKRNKTALNFLGYIKSFLTYIKKEHPNIPDLLDEQIRPKTPAQNIIYLTWEELMIFYHSPIKKEWELYRDMFCFAAFTGLRISDLRAIRPSDIMNDTIHIVIQKTGTAISVELNNYSRCIYEKYKNIPNTQGTLFPYRNASHYNVVIKDIAKELGINTPTKIVRTTNNKKVQELKPKYELITSHCARKTFVVNCLSMGISPNIVIKWTGHSTYSAMKPYIDILDKEKQNAMELFNQR